MLLDAEALQLVLTPEQAIGLIQKEIQKKGWDKFEFSQIKLFYTPFYCFSFDILIEGQAPTGNAAVNAFTGELNDFIPMLLERPLNRSKSIESGEVERTAIHPTEVKEVAQAKLAAHAGVKKDTVVISAVSKVYVPFYRIWVNVGQDSFQLNVDGCMGAPFGLEQIPEKKVEKGLKDIKSPSDLIEAGKKAFSGEGGSLFSGGKKYVILLAAIGILLLFLLFKGNSVSVDCRLEEEYLGEKPLFGQPQVIPSYSKGELFVKGSCFFLNKGSKAATSSARVFVLLDGQQIGATNFTSAPNIPPSDLPTEKRFSITWKGDPYGKYSFGFQQMG